MKKGVRIILFVLLAVVILLLACLVALQSPTVQTYLARKAVTLLQDKIDGDIRIGGVAFKPFNALVLDDVALIDRAPYSDGTFPARDTLLSAGSLSVRFSLKGLLYKERIRVSRLRLSDAVFNLVTEPAGEEGKTRTNIDRIFQSKPKDGKKEKQGFGDLLEADHIEADNVTFRMVNPVLAARQRKNGRPPVPAEVIDWNDLEARVSLRAKGLLVKDGVISGEMERLSIDEKSGFHLRNLSGKAKVGNGQVLLDNLHLQEEASDLHFRYLRLLGTLDRDYKDFVERVRIEAELVEPSFISMKTVSHFAPNLDRMGFDASLTGRIDGTVSDFRVKGLRFQDQGSGVSARIDGGMRGLPDIHETVLDFQLKDCAFGLKGLGTFIGEWAPDTKLDLGKLGKGTEFRLNATAKGTLNRLAVKGDLRSNNAGQADVDVLLRNVIDPKKAITIGGSIQTRDLDAGRIAGVDALGPVTLETALEATLARGGLQVRLDSVAVRKLRALDYDYTGIVATGTYSDQAFDGRIVCDDPNLNFLLQGKFDLSPRTRNAAYQFYANVGYADLNALHLDKRGVSKISLEADANFIYTRDKDLLGEVKLRDVVLENDNGRHYIGDITASAHANDDIHRISLDAPFAQGSFVGEKSPVAMVSDLKELLLRKELPALLDKPGNDWDGAPYNVNLKFYDSQQLLGYILPGLYIEKNTNLHLSVDKDGLVDGSLNSGRLALGARYLKDFRLNLDNRGGTLRAGITGSAFKLGGGLELRDNRLDLRADDNRFNLTYRFDNETEAATKANLSIDGVLSRDEEDLVLTAKALPSGIWYEGHNWNLDSQDITMRGKDIDIRQFRLYSDEQSVLVDGGISPDRADTLSVRMDRFDISLVNTFLMDGKMDIQGKATGRARLVSPSKPSLGLLAGITCDSTSVAGRPLGQLRIGSAWNEEEERFDLRLRNLLDGDRNIDVNGFFRPKDKAVHADVTLDRFDLGCAAPILTGIFSEFGGGLKGTVHVDGTLDKPEISNEGLEIVDGLLGIDFTQVTYHIAGPLSVDTEGLHFKGVSLSDGADGKGTVSGGILFGGFSNMKMDTHVQFERMQVLGIPAGQEGSPVSGDVFATGRVDITGPFNGLRLNVDARTVKDGDLYIPLKSGSSKVTGDLLVFTQPAVEVEEDPYEVMMRTTSAKAKSRSDLEIRLKVRATPSVTAHINIGEDNTLEAMGSGLLDIGVGGGDNSFTLNGDYALSAGNFHFSALGMVNRLFTIQDGSTIRFNGDIMDSDLKVTGVYSTKASLSPLLNTSSTDDSAGRRQVDCIIGISGKLRNPEIDLDIQIPELDPGTQGLVESALNTEDKKMKQFLYLLIANSFLPNEESGITSGETTNMLYSNMTGIMAGQLNSIFEKLNIPLDLGLNYQQNTATGSNMFDVAVSTQLFNNRVVVNGTIGNRRLYGTTTDEMRGDLDIDIKLDKPGTIRLNLFSHSADQYTSYLDNSQRNGVGIAYQRDFNTFRQFFHDLFTPRAKREEEAQQPVERRILQIDSTGRAHPLETNE